MSEPAKVLDGDVEPKAKALAKRKIDTVPIAQPAAVTTAGALIQMVERLALNPNANPDQIERFLAMQERIMAQQAERDFNDAMAITQAKMRPVAADASNPQTRSKYASFPQLDRALRPIYTGDGFALSFNTGDSAPGEVLVLCDVTNCGHTRRYKIPMPADGKGAKGGDVMTRTHATGSAVSYGMRYLLKMIFNVSVGEADDDGNKAGNAQAFVSDEQAQAIKNKIIEVKADVAKLLDMGGVESVSDIRACDYKKVMDLLELKKNKRA